jgi:hypothetical protein
MKLQRVDMAYDLYLLSTKGHQVADAPVFQLDESDHQQLLLALERSALALPLLRRLGDFYQDAIFGSSEAGALRREINAVIRVAPDLAPKLAGLASAAKTAELRGLNLHFAAD